MTYYQAAALDSRIGILGAGRSGDAMSVTMKLDSREYASAAVGYQNSDFGGAVQEMLQLEASLQKALTPR
jgi:hypothetical protein